MEPTQPKKVAWPIKVMVFWIMATITVWALPNPAPAITKGTRQPQGSDWILYLNQKYLKANKPIQYFLLCTGFWQSWDMFSPNPSNLNIWADEVVTYRDGSVKVHQYPRMQILSLGEKYLKERYRKFFERANGDDYSYLWPIFAQRIALECYQDPNNPPVQVELRRHFYHVQPPDKKTVETYKEFKYYTYEVDQKKLKEQAGF